MPNNRAKVFLPIFHILNIQFDTKSLELSLFTNYMKQSFPFIDTVLLLDTF